MPGRCRRLDDSPMTTIRGNVGLSRSSLGSRYAITTNRRTFLSGSGFRVECTGRAMLPNGTVLHGRYRIVRLIGAGGMGAVYEAIDWRLETTVAVKQCRLAGADADSAFEREAKLLAVLRHPGLPVASTTSPRTRRTSWSCSSSRARTSEGCSQRSGTFSASRDRRMGEESARRPDPPAQPHPSRRAPRHQTREYQADATRRNCPLGFRPGKGPARRCGDTAGRSQRVRLHASRTRRPSRSRGEEQIRAAMSTPSARRSITSSPVVRRSTRSIACGRSRTGRQIRFRSARCRGRCPGKSQPVG